MVKRVALTAIIVGLLLLVVPTLTSAGASLSDAEGRVPRSTTYPPPKPGEIIEEESKWAQFALWVSFTPEWPGLGLQWQELWTVVEWQDPLGDWYEVESDDGTMAWQGTLDYIDKEGKAWKVWWVDPPDYGKGPFRWVIYDRQGGNVMVVTHNFYLPSGANKRVIVETSVP